MYPACWGICLQSHAVLGTHSPHMPDLDLLGQVFTTQELEKDGQGFKPDWTVDYAGAELFYIDGWAWSEEPVSEIRLFLEKMIEWDFIVQDPERVLGLNERTQNPPLLETESQTIQFTCNTNDIFMRLPQEILQELLCFLPTSAVQAVRLASRSMAAVPLSATYWRSRFQFPNELSHINLPLTSSSGQVDYTFVDWKNLCDRLFHPIGEQFKWWQNRKRISTLTRKLAQRLLHQRTINLSEG